MSVESLFLKYSVDKLTQYTARIEICLGKLTEEQIWARGGSNENAVGNLALHLAGNVGQWIVSALGDKPSARDRDAEFAARSGYAALQLVAVLRQTVDEAVQVISGLDTHSLTQTYQIQNYCVSGTEVVYHAVEHFSYHAGQIIFATKLFTGDDLNFYPHLQNAGTSEQAP